MKRLYDIDDAARLCSFSHKILETINRTLDARAGDAVKVEELAREIYNSKVLASQIETALLSENPNVALQPIETFFIQAVYICSEGDKVIEELNNTDKSQLETLQRIRILNSMQSSLKWFFSNKQAKERANAAYDQLANEMNGDFPIIVKNLAEAGKKVDSITVNEACGAVYGYEREYKKYLEQLIPDLMQQKNLPPIVNQKIDQMNSLIGEKTKAETSCKFKEDELKKEMDKTIHLLIMQQTMEKLREHDVDVLSQSRKGIRVKSLRDYGYRNMADIYAASPYQLASVNGISQDAALLIKSAANEIAGEIEKTVKLKINADERTPNATALLKAAYKYDQYKKAYNVITPDIEQKLMEAPLNAGRLADLNNNLSWVFSDTFQKQQYIEFFQALKKDLSPDVIHAVQEYSRLISLNGTMSEAGIWEDFSQRSIEYFNLLEELYPEIFGNDDLLYGLPEDLAREIQDQTFFPQGLKVTLRRYQEWGVKYILHQEKVLLGDEMGLGKTIQAIATMVSLRNTGAKKFLVICPASVLPNWCKEIDNKSEFHSIMVHGYRCQEAFDSWHLKGGVAVTTYETLRTLKIPGNFNYDLLVVDEAHFIKNKYTQRSKYVRMFGESTKRILYMTGTALENKVDEMISLLQVLNPRIAAKAQSIAFMSTAPQFRQAIAPVYYRRKRDDVLTELPAITYSREWCDLQPEEYEAYKKAVLEKNQAAIRKVSWVITDLKHSAKACRMKEIIDEAETDGRKVLVFSFYLETINRVIEMLGDRCTSPINGSVPVQRRQEIIDEFEKMPAGAVLPAQIQAGGTGLNIQSASVVIICEPQLKPSIENQAISRAYRMGQTRKVLVYRLLALNTIDERIDDMLTEKQAIFDAFADISEAAKATQKEEQQIDDKTFGKLIQEEIDRINAENGQTEPNPDR